ncbi:MAG: molybdopterin-dependent oxidoreductase [Coriobacteriales bacterium]|jgi:molybdopterin-containing oxidoreductase family molybdopterin binding subunit|nr:molybdopterin-dependent oxidoreductase [Coriobacteriales bacterium]
MSEESYVYTACPGWGDHDYCAIKTIVKDGRIVRTEKADYTGPEFCEGHICQKGLSAGRQPYNPNRLLYPLKRAGERGEGKWDRISWDQALDEISAKLLELREQYGPESLVIWNLPAGAPPSSGLLAQMPYRFGGLWGATDPLLSQGLDDGPMYTHFYNFGPAGLMYFLIDPANFDDANFIFVWGANPIENQMRITQHLVRARAKGAKIVDIGLVFDGTAGWCDEFIGVAPGSDGYLALAMANYLVQTGQYKTDFLTQHTIACYLVRDDDGQLLRDSDGNFVVWDESTSAPVSVAPQKGEITAAAPALLGSFTAMGVATQTAFQLLTKRLTEYTLEEAERISTVPAATITRLADEYAAAPNAYLLGALGLRYINQGETYRAFYILGFLTGNLGRPGAGVTAELIPCCYPTAFNDEVITRPLGAEGNKTNCLRMHEFFEQVKADVIPYHAFICSSGNPVHQNPNRARWDDFFSKLELIVDIDIWMTDTGEMADYVLPDCMPFERYDLIATGFYNHVVLQEPAIEPQGEARDTVYLWSELARRVGLGEYFDKTTEEWIALRLQTPYPLIAGIQPPLTYERLKAEKMVRMVAPEFPKFDPFASLTFPTRTGRIEFYNEQLVSVGFELPKYFPCFESPVIDGNDRHPYQLFTGRQRFFMQSMFTDDPITIQLSGGKPAVRMHPDDALREGFKDGDKLEVYNDRGHVVCELKVDQAVPPKTVHVWFGWRRRQFEEGMYNEMLVPLSDAAIVDELAEKWWQDFVAVRGKPDTATMPDAILTGAWDTMWDCACSVRLYNNAGKEA